MFITCLIFLEVLCVVLISCCEAGGRVLTKSSQKILLFYIFFALTAMTFYIIPQSDMDLYRYYVRLENIRSGVTDLYRQLFGDIQVLFNLELYLISKTSINALAPFLSCTVVFSSYSYIYFDYLQRKGVHMPLFLCSLGLFFAWLPYFQIIDNLRSPMAMSICAVCIYKQFYQQKSVRSMLFFYLLACLIHWQALIVFSFVLLYSLYPKIYKIRYLFLLVGASYANIAALLNLIPISYFRIVAGKILNYFTSELLTSTRLFNEYTASRFALVILFILIFEITEKKLRSPDEKAFIQFFQIILLFSLGCSSVPEVIRRFCFLGGFFSVVQMDICVKSTKGALKCFFQCAIWALVLGMQLWALLKMSRFSIRGVDYSGLIDLAHLVMSF